VRRAGVLPLFILVTVMALVFLGGAAFIVFVQQNGPKTTATVTDCRQRSIRPRTYNCTGTWVAGGSLLDGGHVVIGTIDGASKADVGKRIDVRLSGERAYTTSRRLPIVLAGIGLTFAVLGGREVRKGMRR
jgi:hypothetical protein